MMVAPLLASLRASATLNQQVLSGKPPADVLPLPAPPPSRPFSDHGNEKRVPIRVRRLSSITQGHCRFGPALAGSMVGRHCDLEILGASHVLDDALAVVGPPVDAEREVILCHRRALSRLGFGSTFSISFGSTSKT